jgi:hypothetical protein
MIASVSKSRPSALKTSAGFVQITVAAIYPCFSPKEITARFCPQYIPVSLIQLAMQLGRRGVNRCRIVPRGMHGLADLPNPG